jgi:hypothetical protein
MCADQPDDYGQLKHPEPNHAGEHCVEFWGSHGNRWNDANCNGRHYFVCECNPNENHDGEHGYCKYDGQNNNNNRITNLG